MKKTFLLVLTFLSIYSLQAQLLEPVKWDFTIEPVSGNEYNLKFTAKIDEGWTIYSQFTSDDGPVPTAFEFDPGNHFERIEGVKEEGKKKQGMDPLFGVEVIKYIKGPVYFTQKVKVTDRSKPITGYLTFMTCDNERCLPPTDIDFSFDIPAPSTSDAKVSEKEITPVTEAVEEVAVEEAAEENATVVEDDSLLQIKQEAIAGSGGDCYFKMDGNVIDQEVPTIRETYTNPIGDCGEEDVARDQSLLWTFVLGFLGGLVALLTPCVFPMIPLTVSFFTKSSKDRSSGIKNALWYGASIIIIYVAIGLMITAFFGEDALQQLSTDWIANTIFFVVFIAFAISFFGYYEITLPSSWSNKTDQMADKGGLIGTFFMAFTLAIVSFSCTGPIIGSALVESATNKLGPFFVMLGFSSALALPFGLFAAFPGWLNSLPKSGGWMNSVKVVLGFLELALALKFLSVADMTMHWGILPYEIFMGAWVIIFALTTAYLFGLIKFPHDSPVKKLSPVRGAFAVLFLGLTIYLATGFGKDDRSGMYNSLALMSGLAPPAHYNLLLPEPEVDPAIKARFPSFTKCANNIDCFKDYCEGLSYAQEVGKPVMVDFTGYGCVNCRKTEEHIWVVEDVWKKLQNDFVLVSLYTDDRADLSEVLVSKQRETKLRNVGNKWADFQIVNFEQNSQPLYVMMTPDQKVLAAPRGYKEGAKDYSEFLECGLETFKSYNSDLLGSKE
ncbi:MAG: thioredoxin family protein [Saprospiraceae bacterium]|nr:thioredoxin family protein [Saprospiraceae bacterium]